MSDCWKILDIEPTNNKRKIRSAYAAQSRLCHVEENPEEFTKLNQAYQEALKSISLHTEGTEKNIFSENAMENQFTEKENEPLGNPEKSNHLESNRTNELTEDTATGNRHPENTEGTSSTGLLQRLQQAEEARMEESLAKGALKNFIAIFDNARESGKVPRATVWKDFFLSEEFLKEQYEEGFAKGMVHYLSEWSMEGNYTIHALPSNFLLELAIAYALIPEDMDYFSSGQIPYERNAGDSFYGRECAVSLWNMQSGRGSLPIRILNKPENLVRMRSFADYIRLRRLNQNHQLTPENRENWKNILACGCVNHMYEQNGKGSRNVYENTRSVCLIRLYTFWIQEDEVPPCVLEYMYKEYNLKNVAHSSSKHLYNPLRQEILKRYPTIEDVLFGAESQHQMETNWYKTLVKIIADHHSDYDKGIYEETEQTKKQVQALFDRPEWPKIKDSQELFDKMFLQLHNRMVVPTSLANRLIDFYLTGKWENTKKAASMVETLIQSQAFIRKIQDIHDLQPVGFGKTGIEDINDDNRDFWYYYLMVGFGYRKIELEPDTEALSSVYTLGANCYLPLYIKYMYYPSPQWIKQFVGYSSVTGEGGIQSPTTISFVLPDENTLRVEFHLHYCLYFLNEKPVYRPQYTFQSFSEMAGNFQKTEHFFFLLAITEILENDRAAARKLIEERLSRLLFYPSTLPMITRLLAEGEEEMVQTSDYTGNASYYKKAAPVGGMPPLPVAKTTFSKEETETIEAIYYSEQKNDCFRMLVTDQSVRLYHQKEFGWYELPVPEELGLPAKLETEERKTWAKAVLQQFHNPRPVPLGTIPLEGMDNEQKAGKIIEALKLHEEYHRRENIWSPLVYATEKSPMDSLEKIPSYVMDIPAVKDFFRKEGSFLTESYCVLRFGAKKERVFYCGIYPHAFHAGEYHPDFAGSYEFRLAELSRKIKEKHQILGNFGFGDIPSPEKSFELSPFAIGESGTYYNFDVIHMYRADNLAALLAKMFDFTDVTEVEAYQGCLSFSRLDNTLNYCYGEEELRKSMYSPDITTADVFVRFTSTERMTEFAHWLNDILAPTEKLGIPIFVLEQQSENIYFLSLFGRKVLCGKNAPEENLMGENQQLIWKVWERDTSVDSILEELEEWVLWYMEHGKYGWKLKSCLQVDAAAYKLLPKAQQSEKAVKIRSNYTIYKNAMGILETLKKRTAMTAYSLTAVPKETPTLFDSKLGGMPYWEPGKEYPTDSQGKKLVLLAQINLDKDPVEALIPGGGMLQFFGAADEIFKQAFGARENQDSYRIVYHKQIDYHISTEELINLGVPDSTKYYENHTPVVNEFLIKVEKETVCMGMEDYRFPEVLKEVIEQDFGLKAEEEWEWDFPDEDKSYAVERELANDGFWLLGYPAFASNRKDPRQADKSLRQYDRLLFQFDVHYLSDDYYFKTDNECGIAHFFIRSKDLENRDFSGVMYHWECCGDEEEDDEDEYWEEYD